MVLPEETLFLEEKMSTVATKRQESSVEKLSCREAQLVFQSTDPNLDLRFGSNAQLAAAKHYRECQKDCLEKGVEQFCDLLPLTCKEALEVWGSVRIDGFGGSFGTHHSNSIHTQQGLEHIFGRQRHDDWKSAPRTTLTTSERFFHKRFGVCAEGPCTIAQRFVKSYAANFSGEDTQSLYQSFLFELFYMNDWSLNDLFTSQHTLLSDLVGEGDGEDAHRSLCECHEIVLWWALQQKSKEPISDGTKKYLRELQNDRLDRLRSSMLGSVCGRFPSCGKPQGDLDCGVTCFNAEAISFAIQSFVQDRMDNKESFARIGSFLT